MRIKKLGNGLLVVPVQVTYNGMTHEVGDVVIDTGATRTILHVDAVEPLDINPSPTDTLTRMYGIGGDDFSFRKRIERISLAETDFEAPTIDFGRIEGINGLLGLDIIETGRFVIDLEALELYQKDNR